MTSPSSELPSSTAHKTNRLAGETSPYLLQHAANPVDWYPWGPEALARAKAEDRPIFLSIGYSACHWCHVMERESFENPDIAALMNEHFVNIKVDREERPDLDQIYMSAVQAMTGHGGWPMSVFLTPDLKPFFGGTYFPPTDSRGMAGFPRVLLSVHRAWEERRDEIRDSATEMTEQLRSFGTLPKGAGRSMLGLLDRAARAVMKTSTRVHGGFGRRPSSPTRWTSRCCSAITPVPATSTRCTSYDTRSTRWLGAASTTISAAASPATRPTTGGSSPTSRRCSTTTPCWPRRISKRTRSTHDAEFARVARETMDYVLGRMTDPEGAFYSTEDADSEGVEGKYYVWSLAEVDRSSAPSAPKHSLMSTMSRRPATGKDTTS